MKISFLFRRKSIIYTKRRTRAIAEPKANAEPIHMTRRTARKPKPAVETEPIKRPARKRKQSVVDLDDGNTNTVALPKKKANRATTKSTTRKPRAKKEKGLFSFNTKGAKLIVLTHSRNTDS